MAKIAKGPRGQFLNQGLKKSHPINKRPQGASTLPKKPKLGPKTLKYYINSPSPNIISLPVIIRIYWM